jgi:hypothetical protein
MDKKESEKPCPAPHFFLGICQSPRRALQGHNISTISATEFAGCPRLEAMYAQMAEHGTIFLSSSLGIGFATLQGSSVT